VQQTHTQRFVELFPWAKISLGCRTGVKVFVIANVSASPTSSFISELPSPPPYHPHHHQNVMQWIL
jgi:hypothetical protein